MSGIVVQLSNLQRTNTQQPFLKLLIRLAIEALQFRYRDAANPWHGLGCRDQLAGVDVVAETQIVRMEHSSMTIGQDAITKHLQQSLLDMSSEVVGTHMDAYSDIQWNVSRGDHHQIVTDASVGLQIASNVL